MSLIKISTAEGIILASPFKTVNSVVVEDLSSLPIPRLEGEFEGEPNGSPSPKGEGDA